MDFGTKRGVSEAIKPEPDVKRPKIKMEENDGYSNLSSIPMALPARIKPERTKSESKSEIKLESVPASVAAPPQKTLSQTPAPPLTLSYTPPITQSGSFHQHTTRAARSRHRRNRPRSKSVFANGRGYHLTVRDDGHTEEHVAEYRGDDSISASYDMPKDMVKFTVRSRRGRWRWDSGEVEHKLWSRLARAGFAVGTLEPSGFLERRFDSPDEIWTDNSQSWSRADDIIVRIFYIHVYNSSNHPVRSVATPVIQAPPSMPTLHPTATSPKVHSPETKTDDQPGKLEEKDKKMSIGSPRPKAIESPGRAELSKPPVSSPAKEEASHVGALGLSLWATGPAVEAVGGNKEDVDST